MEAPQPENKYTKYITGLKNKISKAYVFGPLIGLLILIIGMLLFILFVSGKKTVKPVTSTPVQYGKNPAVLPTSLPVSNITTPMPSQAAAIISQTQPQITPFVAASYTVSKINIDKSGLWAVVMITNPNVGTAAVIEKKENGQWKVVLGPGTYFPQQEIQSAGVPQSLMNSYYSNQQPAPTSYPGDLQ
jgi:hypothetical protein